jgi:hypothetical protein
MRSPEGTKPRRHEGTQGKDTTGEERPIRNAAFRALLVVLTGVAACRGALAQTTTAPSTAPAIATIEPAWTWDCPGGIEWAESVGPSKSPAVLAGTADGLIELIDVATGKSRLERPIQAGRGVRPAADNENAARGKHRVAYCFDRTCAYAIDLAAPAKLRWQVGERSDASESYPGDPEFLSRILAACATSEGVVIADATGELILFERGAGRMYSRFTLERFAQVELRAFGERLSVLWSAGGRTRCTTRSWQRAASAGEIIDLGDTWPIWSEFSFAQVLVWPRKIGVVRRGGVLETLDSPLPSDFSAGLVSMSVTHWRAWPRSHLLAIVDDEWVGVALDSLHLSRSPLGAEARIGAPRLLRVAGDLAGARASAVIGADGYAVCGPLGLKKTHRLSDRDYAPAGLRAPSSGPASRADRSARVIDVLLWGWYAYGLVHYAGGRLELIRDEIESPGKDTHASGTQRFYLNAGGTAHSALLCAARAVVVGANRMTAFDLP